MLFHPGAFGVFSGEIPEDYCAEGEHEDFGHGGVDFALAFGVASASGGGIFFGAAEVEGFDGEPEADYIVMID